MAKIIECIPNFSEGRDQGIVGALVDVAMSVPCVYLLDHT